MLESPVKVVVVGQGYVGLPLAMRAAEVGYSVVGFDTDPVRVGRLQAASSYVEDVPSEQLASALSSGRYVATAHPSDITNFRIAVITVPTPLRDRRPDLSYIIEAGQVLARYLVPGALVILESTTYPGTTESLLADLLQEGSGLKAGAGFHLGYSPERIDPGNERFRFANTPKIVSGIDEESLTAVQGFYSSLVETTIAVARPREAELAKLIENTFRHVNVALVNELAMFASELDVDIWDAIDAASTKPFGFMRFNPGPGVGGHCLPIDPSYLSWHVRTNLGRNFRFVELANEVNDHMPDYVVHRLTRGLNLQRQALNGSKILLLGLAYKPNTSDIRESPALSIADKLLRLGAEVAYIDAHVRELDTATTLLAAQLRQASFSAAELRAADAVLLLTDHDDVDYGFVTRTARYVLDTRHRCRGTCVEYL